ncbi:hypothetical protein [Kitasatospora brasiliensis]|uniref:hypothetical protein n=1 Tax=Kitasatospora brasiliensis TaxID=3058040 RepID=UPI00292F01AB|nr:hypothetical protein [Kitasatospora sp. K002]
MTLIQPPLMVTGGIHPARALRMMVRDLSRGSQGITEGGDLKVRSTPTPGPGVRVGNGSAIIRGATWGQGSYTQYNSGDHLVPIAPTGGTGRTDLLVLRVEDPEYEGSRNPSSEDIGYFHVIPGVSATTAAPPPGMTAIALARITQPPNCQTITNAMITDLRTLANPRRERRVRTIQTFKYSSIPSSPTWQDWPASAGAKVDIDIPYWATNAAVITTLHGLRVAASVNVAFRNVLGGSPGSDAYLDTDAITTVSRADITMVDHYSFRQEQRGTTQTLAVQSVRLDVSGNVDVNNTTTLSADVDFVEDVY